jgi:hypothetical protein
MRAQIVHGQPSWRLASDRVEAYVTELGGMLAPVTFDLGELRVQPFAVAPWAEDPPEAAIPILRALRGDFFCMPFGLGAEPYREERHPLHGETANEAWTLVEANGSSLLARLRTKVRQATVTKTVELRRGQTAVYQRHTVSGAAGPVTYGMHATLRFPAAPWSGLISTSPFIYGQVFPGKFEEPAQGGCTSLLPGAAFDDLTRVPLERGGTTDLTRYPAREGFEDLAIVYNAPGGFAWSAVAYPGEGYLYWCLKDPRVLSATIFWISNGGRHYAPWNGRHRRVMGVEEVTTALPAGISEAIGQSPMSSRGLKTHAVLDPDSPLHVSVISGCAPVPPGFDHVASVERESAGIAVLSKSGLRVKVEVDLDWLYGPSA